MTTTYRIVESTSTPKTFTPQFSDDGVYWKSINGTTSLTREGAEQLIESFINKTPLNEIIHTYQPSNVKPLLG